MKPAEIREETEGTDGTEAETVDYTAMSDDELAKKLEEGRAELFNLRFQMATSQLDNTARVKTVKKDIARVLTEQRAREIAAEKSAAAE